MGERGLNETMVSRVSSNWSFSDGEKHAVRASFLHTVGPPLVGFAIFAALILMTKIHDFFFASVNALPQYPTPVRAVKPRLAVSTKL